jgi:hypothetical protein
VEGLVLADPVAWSMSGDYTTCNEFLRNLQITLIRKCFTIYKFISFGGMVNMVRKELLSGKL